MSTITVQEREQWNAWFTTHSDSARNAIIERYIPLVLHIATKVHGRTPKCVELADLVQAGNLGLMDALPRFDPTQAQFKTFAGRRILGAMLDWMRDESLVPRLTNSRHRIFSQAEDELTAAAGRPPTDDEIQRHLAVDDYKFSKIKKERNPAAFFQLSAFSTKSDRDDDVDIITAVSVKRDNDARLDAETVIQKMLECGRFKLTHVLIVKLHYFEQWSLKQVGEAIGLDPSRVSQLHNIIIEQLQTLMESAKIPNKRGTSPGMKQYAIRTRKATAAKLRIAEKITWMLANGFSVSDAIILRLFYIDLASKDEIADEFKVDKRTITDRIGTTMKLLSLERPPTSKRPYSIAA